jgi:GNAT superfamily N-acetyltransferase
LVRTAYAKYFPRTGVDLFTAGPIAAPPVSNGHVHVISGAIGLMGVVVAVPHPDDGILRIECLAVQPMAQRRGVGRALLAFAEALCRQRGLRRIEIRLNEAMWEVAALLARLGYQEVDYAERDGLRHVVMRKDISGRPS